MQQRKFYLDDLYSAVRVTHLHYAKAAVGWSYGDQKHNNTEFKYCAAGSFRMWIDGEAYDLYAGDAVVINPGLHHRTDPVAAECEFLVFHFDVESEHVRAAFKLLASPLIRAGVDEEQMRLPAWIDRFLADYGDSLERGADEGKVDGQDGGLAHALFLLKIQSRLLELISLLGETIMQTAPDSRTMRIQPAQLHLAREAAYSMESNFPSELKVGELAVRLGVHRSYLCDCFNKVYGMSPRAYLNSLRLRQAKQLLQDTPSTVEEIALRLKFSSSAHFCRFFRQMTGLTPGRFRNA